jgi:hypothetical protein
MDLFVVPTIGFDLLYAFVIVRLDRRDLVWINSGNGLQVYLNVRSGSLNWFAQCKCCEGWRAKHPPVSFVFT